MNQPAKATLVLFSFALVLGCVAEQAEAVVARFRWSISGLRRARRLALSFLQRNSFAGMLMKGVIDKIWENKTEEGKEYLILSIGGERYSLWDQEPRGYLQEGTAVDYQWSQSGRFRKITEISKIEGELDPGAYQGKKTKSIEEIVRMSCVKSAAELVSRFDVRPEEKVDLTLGIARRFERYITGAEEGEPMESEE